MQLLEEIKNINGLCPVKRLYQKITVQIELVRALGELYFTGTTLAATVMK